MIQLMMWVEQLSYSTWVRESNSIWAFPMYLFAHTLGMSVVAGGAAVISLALLGLWPKTPLKPLARMYPVMMLGFWVNAFTGVSIFMKDANSYGRNTDFYVKLLFVIAGVILMRIMQRSVMTDPQLDAGVVPPRARRLALAALLCWFFAIITGRLIAYVGPVPGL